MDIKLSQCGFRCDLCLAYKPNIEAQPENRERLSDGWHTYFGFRIPPEDIFCAGCSSEGEPTLDKDCPVRPCVTGHDFQHCAQCEQYICDKLTQRLITFEEIQAKFNQPIPETDRQLFIFPYENAQRLEQLRQEEQ